MNPFNKYLLNKSQVAMLPDTEDTTNYKDKGAVIQRTF